MSGRRSATAREARSDDSVSAIREHTFRRTLLRWGSSSNLRVYPWRQTRDPYELLIAEVMLARTRPEQVLLVYHAFLARFPTPTALAKANESDVDATLEPLGLHWRGPLVLLLGRALDSEFLGRVPLDADVLISLPGVGPYAASMVVALLGERPPTIMDANVARIMVRMFGLHPSGEPRRDRSVLAAAARCQSARSPRKYALSILDFGAAVCVARTPKCERCPMKRAEVCEFVLTA